MNNFITFINAVSSSNNNDLSSRSLFFFIFRDSESCIALVLTKQCLALMIEVRRFFLLLYETSKKVRFSNEHSTNFLNKFNIKS